MYFIFLKFKLYTNDTEKEQQRKVSNTTCDQTMTSITTAAAVLMVRSN